MARRYRKPINTRSASCSTCVSRNPFPIKDHASFGLLRAIVAGKFAPPRTLRAELPEKLEGIILRAMRTAPEERFESVHALGRELWEFASPDAREQWRSYYLDDPLRAPPKASTHAMPLIEAMVRGIAAGTPPGDPLALRPDGAVAARGGAPAGRGDAHHGRAAEAGHRRLVRGRCVRGESALHPAQTADDGAVRRGRARWRSWPLPAWLILRRPSGGDSPTVAAPVGRPRRLRRLPRPRRFLGPCRCSARAARTASRGSARASSTATDHRPPVADQ